jgi:hypothetical protein
MRTNGKRRYLRKTPQTSNSAQWMSLKGALGLQAEHVLDNSCEAVLDLIGNQDFDELAKSALTFANGLALQTEARAATNA